MTVDAENETQTRRRESDPTHELTSLGLSKRTAKVLLRLGYPDRSSFLTSLWGPLEADGLASRLARAHGVGPSTAQEIRAAWERGRRASPLA